MNITSELDRFADEFRAAGERTFSPEERVYLTETKSALHEAGHLAAALILGIECSASIFWDAESSARTFVNGTMDEHLFTTFAGVVVSLRYHLPKSGVTHDVQDIAKRVEGRNNPEEAVANAWSLAERFVTEREPEIFRLAYELQKRKTLDCHSAKAIFDDATLEVPVEFLRAVATLRFARWEDWDSAEPNIQNPA